MRTLKSLSAGIFRTDLNTGASGSIKLNVWIAQLSGVPILGLKKETLPLKVLVLVYGLLSTIVMTYFYTYFEMYDLVMCWPNLDKITQNACLSLTHVAGAFKVANVFYNLKDITKVVEKLQFVTRKFVVTPRQREAYLRGELLNKLFLMGYATLVGFTGIMAIIMLYSSPETIAGNGFPYRVYLPQWLPFDICLLYMGFGVLILAIQIVSIDYLNISLMNLIRFHLNVLNLSFEELILPDNIADDKTVLHIKGLGNPIKRLEFIVEHHTHLKSIRDDVEKIFRIPVLMQFAVSLSIFALTGFQATVRQGNSSGDVLIYFYCGCISCELFFYCWFGNEVFEQNKTLSISGFNSTWYKFDLCFQKSLVVFLANAQRPFLFTAGGFMSLSLPSFAGILSRAYTYIAVLRQVYGK